MVSRDNDPTQGHFVTNDQGSGVLWMRPTVRERPVEALHHVRDITFTEDAPAAC